MSTDTPDRGGAPRPASTLENGTGRSATTAGEPAVSMPPSDTRLLVAAGVCLLVPVLALLWVSSYARETPRLGGIPFFFWYQFAWVFLTSALTYTAHRLVLAARRPRNDVGDREGDRS
jgi:hypothetical protein